MKPTYIEIAEMALSQAIDAEDVASATLRTLGDTRECKRCIVAVAGKSALLCVAHGNALRAYNQAARRRDAAGIALLFARARAERERRVA